MSTLVEVQKLKKYFPVRKRGFFSREMRWVKAVDCISFRIDE